MSSWFSTVPLWLLALLTLGVLLTSILVGVVVARLGRRRRPDENRDSVGTVVGAALGLLAFILAFTFGMTATRFDARKAALLDEVTAIETVYMRVDLIPEERREAVRALLREYVALRVDLAAGREELQRGISRSEEIQRELWDVAGALADADLRNPDVTALWIDALNEMISLHTTRVAIGIYQRVPVAVWATLIGITVLAMGQVGYLFGYGRLRWTLILGLTLAFSVVLVLIADLDRSGSGGFHAVRFSHQPMVDLAGRIAAPPRPESLPAP